MDKNAMDVVGELENAEVVSFGKNDYAAFNRLKAQIEKGFTKASEAYVMIACNLWQIYHNEYYRINNYKSIADFALEEYEFKKTTTHNYIRVVEKFGEITDGKASGLKEQFKQFKCSQLINMLSFTPEQLEAVQPDWSVRKIIEFGKTPLQLEYTGDDSEDEEEFYNSSDAERDSSEYMTLPEIESGRTLLAECYNLDEILENKEVLLSAYNDLRNDANFKNRNVRFVIELAFD